MTPVNVIAWQHGKHAGLFGTKHTVPVATFASREEAERFVAMAGLNESRLYWGDHITDVSAEEALVRLRALGGENEWCEPIRTPA